MKCLRLVAFFVVLLATSASVAGEEWDRHADVETVTVTTTKSDGTKRETTVWLVVVDGVPYIRTGSTRWGDDVVRDQDIVLRIGEVELPVRAVFIEADAERQPVFDAFRAKYGFEDRFVAIFRGRHPKLMRLEER